MEYIAAGIIAAVASIVVGAINYYSTKKTNKTNQTNVESTNESNKANVESTNKANQEINQSQLDYQMAVQQQEWERNDTQYQRQVADLQAAGLSPLAATSGYGSGTTLGAPSQNSMQAPFAEAFQAIAPQLDGNALVQSILRSGELGETRRHNVKVENQKTEELSQESEKILNAAKSLELEDKKVQNQVNQFALTLDLQTKQYNELVRLNNENISQKERDIKIKEIQRESEELVAFLKQKTGQENLPITWCHNDEQYYRALRSRQLAFAKLEIEFADLKTSKGSSKSRNRSVGVTGALGETVGPEGGAQGSVGVNGNFGGSESQYESHDRTSLYYTKLAELEKQFPFPILSSEWVSWKKKRGY